MFKVSTHLTLSLLCGLLIYCFSTHIYALDSDQQQSITIQADTATFNATNNQATYQGHVELIQGTLKMTSDTLLIQSDGNGVTALTAIGKPASYSQKITADKPIAQASAEKIIYHPREQKIELTSQAQLRQGDSLFQGDTINYDLKQRTLSASANSNKTKSTGRVKLIIPPQKPSTDSISSSNSS